MDYRIENKDAFQVFGYEGIFNTDGIGVNADILHDNAVHPNNPHELWNQNYVNGAYEKLAADAVIYLCLSAPAYARYMGYVIINKRNPGHSHICSVHSEIKTARLTDIQLRIYLRAHG